MWARRLRSDDGQGLITVLFATMMVLALVVAATTITAAQSLPASRTVDRAAALAAAEGGIQQFLADVSEKCAGSSRACDWVTDAGATGSGTIGSDGASFSWKVTNPDSYVTDGYVRIRSVGIFQRGNAVAQTRTLMADLVPGAQLSDFLYYSTYETQSSELINSQNSARTISLNGVESWGIAGLADGEVTWNGSAAYDGKDFPQSSVCDALWYNSDDSLGRFNSNASKSFGNTYVDWGESGTHNDVDVTRAGTCEVTFSSGSQMSGDVYSKDALLISSGTQNGVGPDFEGRVWTEWATTDDPAADASRRYRPFASLPDSTPQGGDGEIEEAASIVTLPPWQEPTAPTCVYTGATLVRIDGDQLVITSPMTPEGDGACYTSQPEDPDETGPEIGSAASVLDARIDIASGTTILVRDAETERESVLAPSDQWGLRDTSNSLFLARGQQGELEELSPESVSAVTYAEPEDESSQPAVDDALAEFVSGIGKDLDALTAELEGELDERNDADTALEEQIIEVFEGALVPDPESPDSSITVDRELKTITITTDEKKLTYSWTLDTAVKDPYSAGETVVNPLDAESTDIEARSEEIAIVNSGAVSDMELARVGCEGTGCDDAEPQESPLAFLTINVDQTLQASGSRSTPVRAFPLPGDRTSYEPSAGDLYVEGELDGALTLVAENDIVVTGDIIQQSGSIETGDTAPDAFTSADALALVSGRNVAVYHPIACLDHAETDRTDAGFCPNDITGLYEEAGPLSSDDPRHPSRQYMNLAETPPARIDAAVYALGGSFYLANHDKGTDLGTLRLNGAVYQQHRGAMGVEWAITLDQRTRPHSGYALDYTYDSTLPTKRFPFIPSDGRTHVGAWTLVGTSEILNEEGTP